MIKRYLFLFATLAIAVSCNSMKKDNNADKVPDVLLKTPDIRVRDPFILADRKTKTYYLYASISNRTKEEGLGVEVYTSKDLRNWTRPKTVFKIPSDFWAKKWVWAPEVHKYKGKYYLFVTFTSSEHLDDPPAKSPAKNWPPYLKRGTQILVSDTPEGPFKPFANKPMTPEEHMCLDGTLWVEEGIPYMIYCHEWVEIQDGTVELLPLNKDLSAPEGQSTVLFKASDALWVRPVAGGKGYITDGCFLYRTKTGKLLMIWSSFREKGYAVGIAGSENGKIKGPWKQQPQLLFSNNGGHGMIFKTFGGDLVIALHQPNESPKERMKLYKLKDTGETLGLGDKLFPED